MQFSNTNPTQGEKISTIATLNVHSNDRMALPNPVELMVDGKVICSFDLKGKNLSACNGVSIALVNSGTAKGYGYGYGYGYQYGYGYGYGYGYSNTQFSFNITLDTAKFLIGEHQISLSIDTGKKTYSTDNQKITIKALGATTTETKTLTAGTNTSFLGGDLFINLNGTTGSVTVAEFTSQPTGTSSFSLQALGKWFQIETDVTGFGGTMIKVPYTDAQVAAAGIDENSLRLYYYNGSTWVEQTPGGVDTTNNYVWAITDHFSTWGVFGSVAAITSSTSAGSSGGGSCLTTWTCSQWSSCNNGIQTRTCSVANNVCYADPKAKPNETQTCTTNNNGATTPKIPTKTAGGISGITGAVIGTLGTGGSIAAVVIIVLVLGGLVILIRRKKAVKAEAN
jgi:hypothetical protein